MIQAITPISQWVVAWDNETSGYRATAGDRETGAYTSPDAAMRAAERGEAAPRRAKRAEGLVPCQQSLTPPRVPEPGPAPADKAASRPFSRAEQRGRRWRITLTDGEKQHKVDSQIARLVRCQRRVKAWSDALPRLNRRWRRALKGRAGPRIVMLTLTYQEADAWEPNHIRNFMLSLRQELKKNLWAYTWVLEMQERGAPHYHVLLYVAPNTNVPAPDEAGLWTHGATRRETAKRGPKYILTYVGKEYQKEGLPHGARMFAVHIGKKTATEDELFGFRLSAAPPWLQKFIEEARALVGPGVRWKRQPGGGWLITDTGEVLQSAWWLFDIQPVEPQLVTGREEEP